MARRCAATTTCAASCSPARARRRSAPASTAWSRWAASSDETTDPDVVGSGSTPFKFNDPGDNIGPKSCDLWKPVIAAVNGMACGGAFYMLGEVEFIIAAEHATFFDPHVTYGMTAAFEPIHMRRSMPFGEIMRLSLLGNYERLSATARVRDRSGLRGRAQG